MNYICFKINQGIHLYSFLLFKDGYYYSRSLSRDAGSKMDFPLEHYTSMTNGILLAINKKQTKELMTCRGNGEIMEFIRKEFPECFL